MQNQPEEAILMNSKDTNQPDTDFPREIGRPATGALAVAGYTHLEQLTRVTKAELLKLHGVGPKAIRILRETLEAQGMSFAKPIQP